jgi:putative FmdB family regulatory protein
MPMYEYRCLQCGQQFERLRRMADADRDIICPKCQATSVERLISAFAMGGCTATPGGGFT